MSSRPTRVAAVLLAGSLLLPPIALAQLDEPGVEGYLTAYLDNDVFGGTDRNYTNGARLSWISEGEPLLNLFPARRQLEKIAGTEEGYGWIREFSGFDDSSVRAGTLELNYGLSLTQLMFTPEDPEPETQPPGQRRYAGWLGLGFSVHAKDARALNAVEVIIGTTGPRSWAEETQDLVHAITGSPEFQGWDDQIPNEVTFDLSFVQKRRARFLPESANGLGIDGLTEWGLRLGTFRTDAHAGGFLRVGINLPADFSDPRVSATAYSHRYFVRGTRDGRRFSAYALFGVLGTAVAHDATLDGPLFSDFDTGNDRAPFVQELLAGFGLRWGPVEAGYVHTFRSETFDEQGGGVNFGSVSLRLRL